MPPFATARLLCTSRDGPRNSGVSREVPTITKVLLSGLYDFTGKIDFSKHFQFGGKPIHCYICSVFF